MDYLGSKSGGTNDTAEVISQFKETIRLQKEQLFGITLYLQGIELLYSGKPEVVEMNRQSFQNIQNRAENAITAAESLLQQVKEDPGKVKEIKRFKFPPISGNPMLDQMTRRAQILVQEYERLFPGRPRSKLLNQDEQALLMMQASEQLGLD